MKDRVKLIRKNNHLNMQDFGSRLGVTAAAISRIESGERTLTDQMAKLICKEFHIKEHWLKTGLGDMDDLPEDENAILISDLIENINDEYYKEILNLIRLYKEADPADRKVLNELARRKVKMSKDQD